MDLDLVVPWTVRILDLSCLTFLPEGTGMRSRLLTVALAAIGTLLPATAARLLAQEQGPVYAAAVQHGWLDGRDVEVVIVRPESRERLSSWLRDLEFLREMLRGTPGEMLDDLMAMTRAPQERIPAFSLGVPVRVLSEAEEEELERVQGIGSFWATFRARYPGSGGYVTLSPIAWSQSGEEALLRLWTIVGPSGCRETVLLLRRRGGDWEVADEWLVAIC